MVGSIFARHLHPRHPIDEEGFLYVDYSVTGLTFSGLIPYLAIA